MQLGGVDGQRCFVWQPKPAEQIKAAEPCGFYPRDSLVSTGLKFANHYASKSISHFLEARQEAINGR